MKSIIDGKKYDTETSRLIGEDSFSNPGDLHHWQESLYVTKNGSYFLAGSGGAMSKYSQQEGSSSWSGSSNIYPFEEIVAFRWAEDHLSADIIEKYFSEFVEEA